MINTLERLVILVVAVVGLVFVYGTLSMAWAECDAAVYPNHEPTEIYVLHITTNGNLQQEGATFSTIEECEKDGAYWEYKGKIRNFTCIPGRGVRPEHH